MSDLVHQQTEAVQVIFIGICKSDTSALTNGFIPMYHISSILSNRLKHTISTLTLRSILSDISLTSVTIFNLCYHCYDRTLCRQIFATFHTLPYLALPISLDVIYLPILPSLSVYLYISPVLSILCNSLYVFFSCSHIQ